MKRSLLEWALFLSSESLILGLFFNISRGIIIFDLYMTITPVCFFIMSYCLGEVKVSLRQALLNRDLVIFISILSIWLYVYAITRNGPDYVFQTLYYPAFLEEFNFRFLIIRFLSRYVGLGRSIVIQAAIYAAVYSNFLVYSPAGYPGMYSFFFVADNFAMSIIYGAIYYLRRNIYFDLTIHLSLYVMDVFLPASMGWLAYVSTPV